MPKAMRAARPRGMVQWLDLLGDEEVAVGIARRRESTSREGDSLCE